MAIDDFKPVIANSNGAPLLLTTAYQDAYVVPNGETHEVQVHVYNVTAAAVIAYWRFTTSGNEIGISIPANNPYLIIPWHRLLGSSTTNKIQLRAFANSSLLAITDANRVL